MMTDGRGSRWAIEAAGRFVTSDQPQLRTASLAALKHQGGRECVPYVVRAVDPHELEELVLVPR